MTRFARARGSKSSNERIPEEATSWHVMRQQLQEKYNISNSDKTETRIKIGSMSKQYMQFEVSDNVENRWSTFEKDPTDTNENKEKKRKHAVSVKKMEKTSKSKNSHKKDKLHEIDHQSGRIKNKKSKFVPETIKNCLHDKQTPEDGSNETDTLNVSEKYEKKMGKQKTDAKRKQDISQDNKDVQNKIFGNEDKSMKSENAFLADKKHQKQNNEQTFKNQLLVSSNTHEFQISTDRKPIFKKKQTKNCKMREDNKQKKDKSYKRRKPETHIEKIVINGMEIEIVKYDGYPVKKEDAERLKELRQKLHAKGVPVEEVNVTMKLERRKAEKALAREKKKVCFHCRKSGHILSQCPELSNSNQFETGICFKCGSTEHTHFQCKVNRGQEFRYAQCFICKEQGHISRQCPDNPRGLYPKGGACKVCGDVTHLKKDCPDLISEKEELTVTLGTLNNNSLEVLEEDLKKTNQPVKEFEVKKKTNKVIKF